MSFGNLLGAPLGGYLYEWGGYRLPFFLAAIFCVLDGIARFFLKEEPTQQDAQSEIGFGTILKSRILRGLLIAVFLGSTSISLLEPTLPLDLQSRLSATPKLIGILFGISVLMMGISSPAVGFISDKFGSQRVISLGLLLTSVFFPLVVFPSNLLTQGIILGLFGIACSCLLSPAMSSIANEIDKFNIGVNYSIAFASFNTAYSLGMIAGPLFGGGLTEKFSIQQSYFVFSILLLLYIPVFLYLTKNKSRNIN